MTKTFEIPPQVVGILLLAVGIVGSHLVERYTGVVKKSNKYPKNHRQSVNLEPIYSIMKKLLVFAAVLAFAGGMTLRAADAKAVWDKDCAKCHGADGKGKTKMGEKVGVKDYTDAKVQEEMKDADMEKAIKEGKKEKGTDKTRMKAFTELSDDEVKGLVKIVRAFKK